MSQEPKFQVDCPGPTIASLAAIEEPKFQVDCPGPTIASLAAIEEHGRSDRRDAIAAALLSEGRCALTLSRSSQGAIRLKIATHTLGTIEIQIETDDYQDLIFGIVEARAAITRITPARTPAYPCRPTT